MSTVFPTRDEMRQEILAKQAQNIPLFRDRLLHSIYDDIRDAMTKGEKYIRLQDILVYREGDIIPPVSFQFTSVGSMRIIFPEMIVLLKEKGFQVAVEPYRDETKNVTISW